jgi:cell division septum initiation protein DivIVA
VTELTNATRAEVEQTLEWARAQSAAIVARAQQGAEQLLGSAGLGDDQIERVADAIVRAAEQGADTGRTPGTMPRAAATASPPPPSVQEDGDDGEEPQDESQA